MNEITRMYKDKEVRIVEKDNEVWFVAKDVADALGYRDAPDMTRRLDPDEKGYTEVRTPSGVQSMNIINEYGLYHATFGSKKKEAKDFTRWVTHDVLPSIRKTGGYSVPQNPEQVASNDLQRLQSIVQNFAELAHENSVMSEQLAYYRQFAPTSDYGDPNRDGNPRYQKRRGYFVSNRGADVAKRDPEKYGYQQDFFYDFLPKLVSETVLRIKNQLSEGK